MLIMSMKDILLRRNGLGWIPNPSDPRDWDIDKLGLVSSEVSETKSLRSNVSQVLNQGGTSSCVAHSFAGAIDILETEAGLSYIPASRLFMYYNSRKFHSTKLADKGTYIRCCAKGLNKFGVPDEVHWKFNVLKINRRPGWKPQLEAHPRTGGSYYAIFDKGDERITAVKAAIDAGHPVVFGTKLNKAFMPRNGPHIIDKPDKDDDFVGRHAMTIVGYTTTELHGLIFEVLNSWGSRWREGGFCWLTDDYIRWTRTADLTIICGWERLQK
jgi:C1A family cysteine protease